MASLGSLARHARSARVSFPASSPELAWRRGGESQDLRPAGSLVILVGQESPLAWARSDSAGSLSARLAIPPGHFRLATVSAQLSLAFRQVSLQANLLERTYFLQPLHLAKHPAHLAILPEHCGPVSLVFRPALSENRQAFRKVSLQAGLAEWTSFLQPLHLAKHPE